MRPFIRSQLLWRKRQQESLRDGRSARRAQGRCPRGSYTDPGFQDTNWQVSWGRGSEK